MKTELVDDLVTFLFELNEGIKRQETVVFCGAGISRNSGLPIVNELVLYILEKLGITKEEAETIINAGLPFEAFIETLSGNNDPNKIFGIYDLGEPNTNHFLLAKLAKAGYVTTICTTNFDQLIEKAFAAEDLVRGEHYQVLYKEAEFDDINWQGNIIRLIKIHGSVEDKENMAITLRQVASQDLSSQRQCVIKHLFSTSVHKNVLVLGYSCSDVFDISPQIEAIRENRTRVVYVDHQRDKHTIRDLVDKEQKNPFRNFDGSKWILSDTDELVKTVWDLCLSEKEPVFAKPVIEKIAWQNCVDAWFSEADDEWTEATKYYITGQILFNISEFGSAADYYKRALSIAREIGDKHEEGINLGGLGNAYCCLGDYPKAIDFYEQALSIAREIGDKRGEGRWSGSLGNVYKSLCDYPNAIDFYEQALSIAREIGVKGDEGVLLGNLGSANTQIDDYPKAIDFYEQALSISREIGDKYSECPILSNLGITFRRLGDYPKAIDYHEQALSISKEIGDKRGEGIRLGNLGNIYQLLSDYPKAIDFYERALNIAREIDDKQGEGARLGNLGSTYDSLGDYPKAIDFYEQALSIAKEIGDKRGEGIWLGNLGSIYDSLDDYPKAIDFYEQALSIAREIGDKHGEENWLGHLGNTYDSLGDYMKAIDYCELALNIAREIGDKHGEGTHLGNLGNVYQNLSDYPKAIDFYEQALSLFRPMLGNDHPDVKLFEKNLSTISQLCKQYRKGQNR